MPHTLLTVLYITTITLAITYYAYDFNSKTGSEDPLFPHRLFKRLYSFWFSPSQTGLTYETPLLTGLYFFQILTGFFQFNIIQTQIFNSSHFGNSLIFIAHIFSFTFLLLSTLILPKSLIPKLTKTLAPITAPLSSILLLPLLPIAKLLTTIQEMLLDKIAGDSDITDQQLFKTLDALIKTHTIDERDKIMIRSILKFRERIVREVMVPRVDIVALDMDSTCQDAIKMINKEGYSRLPVYKDTIDEIAGIVLAKDILTQIGQEAGSYSFESSSSIKSFIKPALFIPETQKISVLLRDFQHKQTHFAIIVDEYGGTEGVVTLEDILEELVGEIADEYDDEETPGYTKVKEGVWVVDGRMPILDLEEELPVSIPKTSEYDTLGGFIIHQVGSIPQKNTLIHQEKFEIKVLKANDRFIEKAQIRLVDL